MKSTRSPSCGYNAVEVSRFVLSFAAALSLSGCAEEPITFRSQAPRQQKPEVAAPVETVDDTPPVEAGVETPPLNEFDLGQPRGGRGGQRPPPSPQCEAGACTCVTDFDCPPMTPKCDPYLWVCVQCYSPKDCVTLFDSSRSFCDEGSCRACALDEECAPGWACLAPTCVLLCDAERACPPGLFCQGSYCVATEVVPP
jgi:hypothetical protein